MRKLLFIFIICHFTYVESCRYVILNAAMCHLRTWICSEKCIIRQVCHCAYIIVCEQKPRGITYCTRIWDSLLLPGCKPVQCATVLHPLGTCNTMVLVYLTYQHMAKAQYKCGIKGGKRCTWRGRLPGTALAGLEVAPGRR